VKTEVTVTSSLLTQSESLIERLVDAEIGDLHAEWVHPNERIRHSVAQRELHLRDIRFVFSFLPRPLAVIALFEVDRGPVRWRCQLGKRDVLDTHVDVIRAGICQEQLDLARVIIGSNGGVSQRWSQEEQRVWIIALYRRAQPTEMRDHKARQKVAKFRRLGSIGGRVVVDSLGAADVVDSDNQRFQVRVAGLRTKVQDQERCGERTLWEFPISSFTLGGWSIPIAGGNYLRQFPPALMRRAVAHWHRTTGVPFLMYFHVWELDPDQPRVHAAPWFERVRQYRNLDRMDGIIRDYLRTYRFSGIADYLAGREKSGEIAYGSTYLRTTLFLLSSAADFRA